MKREYILLFTFLIIGLFGVSFVSAGINDGLVGHWTFDEGSGTIASDSSGSGNTGTLVNGPTRISGKVGSGALSFDGVDDEVRLGSPTALDFSSTNEFSIGVWVYPSSDDPGGLVISRGSTFTSGGYAVYFLGTNGDGTRWRADVSDGANLIMAQTDAGEVWVDEWQFMTIVWDGTSLSIYRNGDLLESSSGTFNGIWDGASIASLKKTAIGADAFSDSSIFNGNIDDVRIYNRSLSQEEIAELYSLGSNTSSPGVAGIHFINAGATGNNDGSDWNNAWTSFSAVRWIRGHTYYVATGTYNENVNIQKTESGSKWIYIKKAIAADHGTDTGWQSSYGTGTAEINGKLYIANSYIEIDGQVGSDNSGHGLRVSNPVVGGNVLQVATSLDHIHLYHIDIKGSGSAGTNPYGTSVENGLYILGLVGREDIEVAYCWIHNVNRDGVVVSGFNGNPGLLFEHNRIERTGGHADPAAHGQGMDFAVYSTNTGVTIRYNKFVDIVGSGNIVFLGGSVNTNVKIYGNIFWSSDQLKYNSSPGVIWTRGITPATTMNGLYVYNNIFHNISLAQIANDALIISNGFVRNNIWEASHFTGYVPSGIAPVHRGVIADHNYYFNNTSATGTLPPIGPTDQVGLSSPFVDAANHDYRIVGGSLAIDNGLDLGSEFNSDMLGNSRPQGSGWDIGAYEYTGTTPVNNPGDLNNDGIVDLRDFIVVTNDWGKTSRFSNSNSDQNADSKVDLLDIMRVIPYWGRSY